MKKCIFSLLLVICMTVSFVPCAWAEGDEAWIEKLDASPYYEVVTHKGELCVRILQKPMHIAIMFELGYYGDPSSVPDALIPLKNLSRVESLHISSDYDITSSCTFLDLTLLALTPNLDYLNLSWPSKDYSPLARCAKLEKFYLYTSAHNGVLDPEAMYNGDFSFLSGLKNLKTLSISINDLKRSGPAPTYDLSAASSCTMLEEFFFSVHSSIYDEAAEPVTLQMDLSPIALPSLKKCTIRSYNVSGTLDVSKLSGAAALEELAMIVSDSSHMVSTVGWSELGRMKKLSSVTISNAQSADAAAFLSSHPSIKTLQLQSMPLTAELASAMPKKLKELSLNEIDSDASAYAALPASKTIQKLSIFACEEVDLSFLKGYSACRELEMDVYAGMDLSPIGAMKKLTKLNLSGRFYDEPAPDMSWLQSAKSRSSVSTLYIHNIPLDDLNLLSNWTGLKELTVEGPITDAAPLAKLKKLTELRLTDTKIEDVTPIGKLSKLKELSLSGSLVSDVTPLAKLKNLEWLGVDGTRVTDLSPLAKLKKLEFVYVSDYCTTIPAHLRVGVNEWAEWPESDTGVPMGSEADMLLQAATASGAVHADRLFAPFMGVQLKLEDNCYSLLNAEDQSVIIPPIPAQYVLFDTPVDGVTTVRFYLPVPDEGGNWDTYSYSYLLDGTPVSIDWNAGLPVRFNRETHMDELLDANGNVIASAETIGYLGHDLYTLLDYSMGYSVSIVDGTGRVIVPPAEDIFYKLSETDEGWILMVGSHETHEFNFIRMDGSTLFEKPVYWAEAFGEGVAPVQYTADSLVCFVDTNGNEVLPARYIGAKPFSEGVALVVNEDFSRSYIDHDGGSQFSLDLSYGSSFRGGHAIVRFSGGHYGMIDRQGNVTMQPVWPELEAYAFENSGFTVPYVQLYDANDDTGITCEWNLDFEGNVIAGGQREPIGWEGLTLEEAKSNYEAQTARYYDGRMISIPAYGD